MNRNQKRNIGSNLKKMNPSDVVSVVEKMCANFGDTVVSAFDEVLREDFKFGDVRMKRLLDAVQLKLKTVKTKEDNLDA